MEEDVEIEDLKEVWLKVKVKEGDIPMFVGVWSALEEGEIRIQDAYHKEMDIIMAMDFKQDIFYELRTLEEQIEIEFKQWAKNRRDEAKKKRENDAGD